MMKRTAKTPRRPTIGSDPLAAVIPTTPLARARRRRLALAGTEGRQAAPKRVRATFHLPEALLDELRATVVALSGPPDRLTLARVAEDALRRELQRLTRTKNQGKPFPRFVGKLVGGRPIGS